MMSYTYRHIIIFGTLIALMASVASEESTTSSDELPTHAVRDPVFEGCKQNALHSVEVLDKCIENVFSYESLNETMQLHNETKCVKCRHLCRKRDAVFDCFKDAAEATMSLSNRSRVLVPALRQLVEDGITSFCENGSAMNAVFEEWNNNECFQQKRRACIKSLNFITDLDEVAFCDSLEPKYKSTDDASFMCREIHSFLECTFERSDSCSTDVRTGVAIMLSHLINSATCSEFL